MADRRSPATRRDRQRGQSLVEFTLMVPVLFTAISGLFEFGLAVAASVGISRASQSGAHMAATAGNMLGADCLILVEVEGSVIVPNDRSRIQQVVIERTDQTGATVYASNTWSRTGSTECALINGDELIVPYTQTGNGYSNEQRCNVLGGCPTLSPARSTVDNIGVLVQYRHAWSTPLGALLGDGGGWTFAQRNVFRMEPHL